MISAKIKKRFGHHTLRNALKRQGMDSYAVQSENMLDSKIYVDPPKGILELDDRSSTNVPPKSNNMINKTHNLYVLFIYNTSKLDMFTKTCWAKNALISELPGKSRNQSSGDISSSNFFDDYYRKRVYIMVLPVTLKHSIFAFISTWK